MPEKEIICVGCPMGCHVILRIDDSGKVTDSSGAECKQGKKYAKQEYESPVRIFTTTVLTKGSARPLLPVRTNIAIPKDKLKECARFVSKIRLQPPLATGAIVVANLLDTGADLVCSAELRA